MDDEISIIENDVQDTTSKAWKILCDYVDRVAEEELEEFEPYHALGPELYTEIYTLPASIAKLKKVKKVYLYRSFLKRIPPEIGQMESLEYFDPYTSYDLHWFPFEITQCKNLIDSRVSTRALYGNHKNRMTFPTLHDAPVRYSSEKLHCSVCKQKISYETTQQMWITLRVGTDHLPLLVNVCSKECEAHLDTLPKPPLYQLQFAHQGGSESNLPKMSLRQFAEANEKANESKRLNPL